MSREEVGARLGRLLAIVPWIASRADGVTLEEIAEQFATPVARIEKDLRLLGEVEPEARMNVSLWEEEGRVFVDSYGHLARPLRITADDAFGLIVAARSILQVPGVDASGALLSAITKVAQAVGGDVDGLEIHLPRPPMLDDLQQALDDGACVQIEYYSAGRDSVGTRVVEPLVLFTVEGRWHLAAFCRTAAAERDFRVDRVRSVRPTGETFVPREPTMRTDTTFDPDASSTMTVRIEVQPEQRWALDRYPVRDVVEYETEGVTRFTIDTAGEAWLERLLLRLSPTARVIEPAESRVGAFVAARLKSAYEFET